MRQDEIVRSDGGKGVSLERAALTMAIAVVFKRLTELPPEDIQELYDLAMELPKTHDQEEIESIRVAMVEILDQEKSGVQGLELGRRPEKAQKWVDYVAARVQQLRKEANLTQVQLAEKTGLPQSHISRIESARLSPSRTTLEKIADSLGRRVSDFDPST